MSKKEKRSWERSWFRSPTREHFHGKVLPSFCLKRWLTQRPDKSTLIRALAREGTDPHWARMENSWTSKGAGGPSIAASGTNVVANPKFLFAPRPSCFGLAVFLALQGILLFFWQSVAQPRNEEERCTLERLSGRKDTAQLALKSASRMGNTASGRRCWPERERTLLLGECVGPPRGQLVWVACCRRLVSSRLLVSVSFLSCTVS